MAREETQTIDATTTVGRWRLICPNGHTNWETTNYHFWCHSCSQLIDADPEYYSLMDKKTGQLVTRDQVVVE